MTRKIALIAFAVIAPPLTAFAGGSAASSVVSLINAMPEPGTLGLLGSGLIGFAFAIRRKSKVTLVRQSAVQRTSSLVVEQTAA